MPKPTFDLQSHSTHSDGALAPAEVVKAAAVAGVETLALSDHDSTGGVREAMEAADDAGIRLVTAVEISALDPSASDIHILGYRIDPDNGALSEQLERSRADRRDRMERMASALTALGYAIDRAMLEERTATGGVIGRPHLAQAVVEHPDNTQRLSDEGLSNFSDFLVAYLIEGKPAFSDRLAPTVEEAAALIHGAGGVVVWAHPYWDIEADPAVLETLDRFVSAGIDGVEAFYVTHTQPQTELLVKRCAELDLLSTGSSDFHGPQHKLFNRFRAFETFGLEPNLGPLGP